MVLFTLLALLSVVSASQHSLKSKWSFHKHTPRNLALQEEPHTESVSLIQLGAEKTGSDKLVLCPMETPAVESCAALSIEGCGENEHNLATGECECAQHSECKSRPEFGGADVCHGCKKGEFGGCMVAKTFTCKMNQNYTGKGFWDDKDLCDPVCYPGTSGPCQHAVWGDNNCFDEHEKNGEMICPNGGIFCGGDISATPSISSSKSFSHSISKSRSPFRSISSSTSRSPSFGTSLTSTASVSGTISHTSSKSYSSSSTKTATHSKSSTSSRTRSAHPSYSSTRSAHPSYSRSGSRSKTPSKSAASSTSGSTSITASNTGTISITPTLSLTPSPLPDAEVQDVCALYIEGATNAQGNYHWEGEFYNQHALYVGPISLLANKEAELHYLIYFNKLYQMWVIDEDGFPNEDFLGVVAFTTLTSQYPAEEVLADGTGAWNWGRVRQGVCMDLLQMPDGCVDTCTTLLGDGQCQNPSYQDGVCSDFNESTGSCPDEMVSCVLLSTTPSASPTAAASNSAAPANGTSLLVDLTF